MLQLATILSMVKPWKTRAILRVFLCIDALNVNAQRAQQHLEDLLSQLRIHAQTRIIAWENVTSLLQLSSSMDVNPAIIPTDRASSIVNSVKESNAFVDINDSYIRGVNELIRQQCDTTSCLYLYLPRPSIDKTLAARYIRVLDMLSNDLPPVMFVHGVSSVTCTQL
jgi:hypothetical protein